MYTQESVDYDIQVARGRREGQKFWNKFGYNQDVDSAAEEIVASWGGAFDPTTDIMSTAQAFTITYNSTTDGSGTTGATQLLFYYIDSNDDEAIGVHVLGSTGTDTTSFSGKGINRCVVYANGGVGANTNDITITATTDGTTQAQIPAGNSTTQQCIFYTPKTSYFLAYDLKYSIVRPASQNPVVTIRGYSWSRVTNTKYEVYRATIDTSVHNYIDVTVNTPFVLGGREVLYFTAETENDNTIVNLRFGGILYDE